MVDAVTERPGNFSYFDAFTFFRKIFERISVSSSVLWLLMTKDIYLQGFEQELRSVLLYVHVDGVAEGL